MRFLMKCTLDMEVANARVKDGSLQRLIQSILEEHKPEAAYFIEEDGCRTACLFVNFNEPSEIPRLAEPWFLGFNARVELHPAMTAQDLAKAMPGIEQAAKKYGQGLASHPGHKP